MKQATPERDSAAFTEFFRENYPRVVAYVRRRSDLDPETVASSVFTIAWERYEQSMARGLPWLYRTAMFEMQNQRRAERRQYRSGFDDTISPEPTGTDEASGITDRLWVTHVLALLPAADREVLKLIYWEDLDYTATGIVLECSPATVAVRAHRARRKFQRLADGSSSESIAGLHPRIADSEVS